VIKALRKAGVEPPRLVVSRKAQPLAGKTFVLTGTLAAMSRDEAREKLIELGAKVARQRGRRTPITCGWVRTRARRPTSQAAWREQCSARRNSANSSARCDTRRNREVGMQVKTRLVWLVATLWSAVRNRNQY